MIGLGCCALGAIILYSKRIPSPQHGVNKAYSKIYPLKITNIYKGNPSPARFPSSWWRDFPFSGGALPSTTSPLSPRRLEQRWRRSFPAAADRAAAGGGDRGSGRGSKRRRRGSTRRPWIDASAAGSDAAATELPGSGADRCVGGRRSFPAAASSIVDPSRGDDLANVPLQACFAVLEPGRAEVRGALQRSAILCRAMVPGEKREAEE
uniref:Uncharacterized protein n=1 Tax=Oryza glumipatula TaxID=40148 RepID=A0A0D9YW72_9ORYZ